MEEPERYLLDAEPQPFIELSSSRLTEVTAAFGDAADLKMPYTHGHSTATAELAAAAGAAAGLSESEIADLRTSGHLHDVGRVAISNAIWEKPRPLTSAEWEEVRMHTYHGERIVARSTDLAHLAPVVGMHHERSDGSGYHRGNRASSIPFATRIVAVADAWVSMQQDRPYRDALDPDEAAAQLQKEVEDDRLDPRAVRAVLHAAGREERPRRALPRGLSQRELEVLRLVAKGYSNPAIADRLSISRRTAEHHVQHIYTKIGVSTRPGAAMFALEHELLEPMGG
ncbi:MAG: HD domain-containing phosphohydrolase [Actinomycetota bacterium]